MPYVPNLKYTFFVNSSNQNVFFAGVHEVKQILNTGLLMTTYTQIYRPVIRVCGSTISSGAYTGIYAKAANGATMDVVNTMERLDSKVFATEHLSSIDVFTKDSPTFNNNINIQTTPDWNNADGWRVVSSSTFQNNPLYAANSGFEKRTDTFYGSRSTRYPGTTAPTQWTISASNDTNFVNIESISKTDWVINQAAAFQITVAHEPYRFFRLAVSQVSADGTNATYLSVPDITFTTINPIGSRTPHS
ncbi:hypothetical protein T492DRAFT_845367 [Pavlovales sp. CCMP2436]|nr:hypothetical protein T492DRAFT_845367 [Pavlovales sp. CCMP2436]